MKNVFLCTGVNINVRGRTVVVRPLAAALTCAQWSDDYRLNGGM